MNNNQKAMFANIETQVHRYNVQNKELNNLLPEDIDPLIMSYKTIKGIVQISIDTSCCKSHLGDIHIGEHDVMAFFMVRTALHSATYFKYKENYHIAAEEVFEPILDNYIFFNTRVDND